MTIIKLNERFERIERAYMAALGGRDPESVLGFDLLPEIFAAVSDTSVEEVIAMLHWRARKTEREADKLEEMLKRTIRRLGK